MGRVQFNLHNALAHWQWSAFPLTVIAVLAAIAIWYLRAVWALGLRGRRWPTGRTVAFLLGLVAVDLALQSPVASFTGTYFQAHVIQHLLLMVTAPPLLALGAPSTLLLQTARRATKTRWLAVLRSVPFAALTHPVTVIFLYLGLMFLFFLTPLINVAMLHMDLMDVINVVFLFGGTLYWWPMIGIDPIVHWKMNHGFRMFNILLSSGLEAFLGIAIIAESRPIASMYTLGGTHSGGALLWVSTEFVTLAAFLPIYLQWIHSEDRVARRSDTAGEARSRAAGADGTGVAVARPLTPWELEWIARTGSAPVEQQAVPRPSGR